MNEYRKTARCQTCGRIIELIGKYNNGTDKWAHVGKPGRIAHFAKPTVQESPRRSE